MPLTQPAPPPPTTLCCSHCGATAFSISPTCSRPLQTGLAVSSENRNPVTASSPSTRPSSPDPLSLQVPPPFLLTAKGAVQPQLLGRCTPAGPLGASSSPAAPPPPDCAWHSSPPNRPPGGPLLPPTHPGAPPPPSRLPSVGRDSPGWAPPAPPKPEASWEGVQLFHTQPARKEKKYETKEPEALPLSLAPGCSRPSRCSLSSGSAAPHLSSPALARERGDSWHLHGTCF